MNRSTLTTRLALTMVAASLFLSGAFAQKPSSFKEAGKHWAMVKHDMVEFDKVVKAKKWAEVHEAAFRVRDDVKMMPGASKALSKAKMAKLNAHIKAIAGLAGELDEAGDARNGKTVVSLAGKFRMHVGMIPPLYPNGALAGKPMVKMPVKKAGDDHGHHGGGDL